ncbi:MAG: PAS domain S-box protein [Myxococcota bacterium]
MSDPATADAIRFRALAQAGVGRVAELDRSFRSVYLSPGHEDTSVGETYLLDALDAEDRASLTDAFQQVLDSGVPQRVAVPHQGASGDRWLDAMVLPLDDEAGERRLLVFSQDSTRLRRAELRLREHRERFERIVENSHDMIVEYDASGRVLFANDRVRQVMGYNAADLPADAYTAVHPEDRTRVENMFGRVVQGTASSARATYRSARADGRWCWIDLLLHAIPQADGRQHHMTIARDVTERMEAEQRVRESEQRYRDLVEKTPLAIVVTQAEAIVYANPAAARICGARSPEELRGTPLQNLLSPEAIATVRDYFTRSSDPKRAPRTIDLRIRGLDGEERHVQGAGNLTRYEGALAFQCIVRDVTDLERSRFEQERLELQLQEARRLESLGVLAGGIAHDFNNLLAVISSSVRFARRSELDVPERQDALGDAEEAADRAARLVKQLLDYAGRRAPEVRRVDLSQQTESLRDLMQAAVPRHVELQFDLADVRLPVRADLVQLERVLMNLVMNAADAIRDGAGRITVRTRRQRLPALELAGWLGGEELGGGDFACLEVEDDGAGMNASTRERIFEPFYSTKHSGHGLGLSAVLGLVQGHRGAIDVRSQPGRGTCFRVALPIAPDGPSRSAKALLLVAEPDDALRRDAAIQLGSAHVDVIEARDREALVSALAAHGEEFDALLVADAFADALPPELPLGLPVLALHDDEAELAPLVERGWLPVSRTDATGHALRDRLVELLSKSDAD